MQIRTEMIVAGFRVAGKGDKFRAIRTATGDDLDPPFRGATRRDLEAACAAADILSANSRIK